MSCSRYTGGNTGGVNINTLTTVSGNLHLVLTTASLGHASVPHVIFEKTVICSSISVEQAHTV